MIRPAFRADVLPVTRETQWRHRFSILTVFFTVVLLSWGAVVTSIEAGLAVPDWPTTFYSMDPLNPIPQWWAIPSILAEHGHRLMGLLVGFSMMILTIWTFIAERRKWVKVVAGAALLLVMVQGILGGLRVVWVSLDLAVVHACVAQLFFSTLVSLTFFTSPAWHNASGVPDEGAATYRFRRVAIITSLGIYIQTIIGALLRHPGSGSNVLLVTTHILGAVVVSGLVFITVKESGKIDPSRGSISKFAHAMAALLVIQVILGFVAYAFISIDALSGRSVIPTVLSTFHMVTGALLMATSVLVILSCARYYATLSPAMNETYRKEAVGLERL